MAALITEAKPRQLQVTRIRQEEEESWISSEELHTDGSSDDDGGRWSKHLHHHHHHLLQHIPHPLHHRHPTSSPLATSGPLSSPPPPPTASEPASQDSPHLTETTRRLSELGVEGAPLLLGAPPDSPHTQEDCVEEQEDIMLWRPKRGSLKLTELATGAITLSSSASSAGKLLTHKDNATSSTDIAEEKGPCTATTAADGQFSSAGAISKCSSVSGATAKSSASAGSVETKNPKGSSPIAGPTVVSPGVKAEVQCTGTEGRGQSCVKSCAATARVPAAAEAPPDKTDDLKNNEGPAKDVVVGAKVHESGT